MGSHWCDADAKSSETTLGRAPRFWCHPAITTNAGKECPVSPRVSIAWAPRPGSLDGLCTLPLALPALATACGLRGACTETQSVQPLLGDRPLHLLPRRHGAGALQETKLMVGRPWLVTPSHTALPQLRVLVDLHTATPSAQCHSSLLLWHHCPLPCTASPPFLGSYAQVLHEVSLLCMLRS